MITREIIDGRPARVAHVNAAMQPASVEDATMIKVIFDDGEIRFAIRPPVDTQAQAKAFDESEHPRDEHGRFTFSGGDDDSGGYAFVSPNVRSDLDFDGAVDALDSDQHESLRDASRYINDQLGVAAHEYDIIGAWADGAENSVMDIAEDSDWETLKVSAAMKGHLADQKQVLVFQNGEGESALYSFQANGELNLIHERLLQAGLAFHTLVPRGEGAQVYVVDPDLSLLDTVKEAADGAEITIDLGRAEFIGTTKEDGTDREQRDDARRIYEAHIERSPVEGAQGVWAGVRDRWGAAQQQAVDHPGEGYSEAAVLRDGVIHTSSVDDAHLALHQNRAVELDQPRSVSVLLDRLGQVTQAMIAKGEKAPVYNLCKLTIKGSNLFCSDSHGIPRIEMPQIVAGQEGAFKQYLIGKGYAVTAEKTPAVNLRATQIELNGGKVAGISELVRTMPEHQVNSLFVSRDDYILDGHHRWAAKIGLDAEDNILGNDTQMKIERVDISITKLLEEADLFTGGAGKISVADEEARRRAWARMKAQAQKLLARAFDPSQPRDEEGKWTPAGGGEGTGSSKPGGKGKGGKKVKKEDFAKAKITVAAEGALETAFFDNWNEDVGMEPEQFKKEFLGGFDATMRITSISAGGDKFKVVGDLHDERGDFIGVYSREIDLRHKAANSSLLELEKAAQGKGVAKKILAGNVSTYEKLGIDLVSVSAGLDKGGYAWAKYGYVPNQGSWDELRRELEPKYLGVIGARPLPSSGPTADSWDQLPDSQQDAVRAHWMEDTHSEFLSTEQQNWRDSGGALDDAKSTLAYQFKEDSFIPEWANDALNITRDFRTENDEPPIPYTNQQLFAAMDLTYEADGEGRNDPEIAFDENQLKTPQGYDPAQGTLPGIEPIDPASFLTKDMRDQIKAHMIPAFDTRAESDADDMEPPQHLADDVGEYQEQYWDGSSDTFRLDIALQYDMAGVPSESEEDEDEELPLEDKAADPVLAAIRSSDPKSIWKVADSPRGKQLLMGEGWQGTLNMKDPEVMARFNKYVGRAA